MGDAALGIVTMHGHSAAVDNPENRAFVRDYEAAAQDLAQPVQRGRVGLGHADRRGPRDTQGGSSPTGARVRRPCAAPSPRSLLPRGAVQPDAYRQVIAPILVTRTEKQGPRIVNAVI